MIHGKFLETADVKGGIQKTPVAVCFARVLADIGADGRKRIGAADDGESPVRMPCSNLRDVLGDLT